MGQCEGCLNQYIQKYNECCCLYIDVKNDILINKCYVEKICDCRNQPFELTKEQAFLAIEKLIKQYDERQQKPQSVMYSLKSIIDQVKNKDKEVCKVCRHGRVGGEKEHYQVYCSIFTDKNNENEEVRIPIEYIIFPCNHEDKEFNLMQEQAIKVHNRALHNSDLRKTLEEIVNDVKYRSKEVEKEKEDCKLCYHYKIKDTCIIHTEQGYNFIVPLNQIIKPCNHFDFPFNLDREQAFKVLYHKNKDKKPFRDIINDVKYGSKENKKETEAQELQKKIMEEQVKQLEIQNNIFVAYNIKKDMIELLSEKEIKDLDLGLKSKEFICCKDCDHFVCLEETQEWFCHRIENEIMKLLYLKRKCVHFKPKGKEDRKEMNKEMEKIKELVHCEDCFYYYYNEEMHAKYCNYDLSNLPFDIQTGEIECTKFKPKPKIECKNCQNISKDEFWCELKDTKLSKVENKNDKCFFFKLKTKEKEPIWAEIKYKKEEKKKMEDVTTKEKIERLEKSIQEVKEKRRKILENLYKQINKRILDTCSEHLDDKFIDYIISKECVPIKELSRKEKKTFEKQKEEFQERLEAICIRKAEKINYDRIFYEINDCLGHFLDEDLSQDKWNVLIKLLHLIVKYQLVYVEIKEKKELCRLTKCLDELDGSNPCKYTCEKCGKVNQIESNYCSECGQKL